MSLSGRITKHRRLSKIMQILERWAPLETAEITHRLAQIFQVEEGEIKRNVTNDLKFLRDEGELTPLYFDKLGKFLSEGIEPEGANFYRIKWDLREGLVQRISGARELIQYQGKVLANDLAAPLLQIRQGVGLDYLNYDYFHFELNSDIHHLSIQRPLNSPENAPLFILALGRNHGLEEGVLKKLNDQFPNLPCCLLGLNDPFLSAFDSEAPFVFSFNKNKALSVHHINSKNVLKGLSVPVETGLQHLKDISFFNDQTKTQHWSEMKKADGSYIEMKKNETYPLPLLARLQDSSGYIFI